jgi:hypothetical protein
MPEESSEEEERKKRFDLKARNFFQTKNDML